VPIKNGIAISTDRKGAWPDNVFVERLWRSIKYEEVYLGAYDTASEARASIGRLPRLPQLPPAAFEP
jgi:putative transposase